jgi:hypothetical protein
MATKLVELQEAAALLGMSTEQLNNLRLSGGIHGIRDTGTWKFKMEELERVADERGIALTGKDEPASAGDSDLALGMDEDDEFEVDSPTTIGKPGSKPAGKSAAESDLMLSFDEEPTVSEELPAASGKGKPSDKTPAPESGLKLDDDDDNNELAFEADTVEDGSGTEFSAGDSSVLAGTDMNLQSRGSGISDLDFEGSDLGLVGSDVGKGSDPGLALGDDDLTIGEDAEDLALGDDDDELVLESGSDITRGASDTGINLGSPSDSGLNLEEEPLDLAGSSVSSLELPEDEDIIDLGDLDADPDEATQLKADEDFQLEPSVAELEDESDEDSGSQVIALEDSEAFGIQAAGAAPGVARGDELEGALEQAEIRPVTEPALPDVAYRGPLPEMPYSIWNVLSLLLIVLILSTTGMLMTDLIRNMWSWEETYPASSSIMDSMVQMLGLDA